VRTGRPPLPPAAPFPVEILWCRSHRDGVGGNAWAFPPAVERLLRAHTEGSAVLHAFGGLAAWGTRLDVDTTTHPHIIGSAFAPPFRQGAFAHTIIDPPYTPAFSKRGIATRLLLTLAHVTRESLWWFSDRWAWAPPAALPQVHAWLVRVGDGHRIRCLQQFGIVHAALPPAAPAPRDIRQLYHWQLP